MVFGFDDRVYFDHAIMLRQFREHFDIVRDPNGYAHAFEGVAKKWSALMPPYEPENKVEFKLVGWGEDDEEPGADTTNGSENSYNDEDDDSGDDYGGDDDNHVVCKRT